MTRPISEVAFHTGLNYIVIETTLLDLPFVLTGEQEFHYLNLIYEEDLPSDFKLKNENFELAVSLRLETLDEIPIRRLNEGIMDLDEVKSTYSIFFRKLKKEIRQKLAGADNASLMLTYPPQLVTWLGNKRVIDFVDYIFVPKEAREHTIQAMVAAGLRLPLNQKSWDEVVLSRIEPRKIGCRGFLVK